MLNETGIVSRPPMLSNLTLAYARQGDRANRTRVRATVRFPDDGFLVVYRGSPHERIGHAAVRGGERYQLTVYTGRDAIDIGDSVTVDAVWDRDRDGTFDAGPPSDLAWFVRGDIVDASATLRWYADGTQATITPSPTRTTTPTSTPRSPITPTSTTTDSPTRSPTAPRPGTTITSETTATDQPSFSLGAVVAVLAALLVVRR